MTGKAVSCRNAERHGLRSVEYRELCALLRDCAELTKSVVQRHIED